MAEPPRGPEYHRRQPGPRHPHRRSGDRQRDPGNFIGTRSVSADAAPNQGAGVGIAGAQNNTIGGAGSGEPNVISGNLDAGIFILGAGAAGNVVKGNRIGTDLGGNIAVGNAREGIYLGRVGANQIGGAGLVKATSSPPMAPGACSFPRPRTLPCGELAWRRRRRQHRPWQRQHLYGLPLHRDHQLFLPEHHRGETSGAANRIAYAPTRAGINYAGIRVREFANNNLVSGNSIFGNGGLAIDLQGYHVTPNDACDIDSGANQVQNYPILSQAVTGTLSESAVA